MIISLRNRVCSLISKEIKLCGIGLIKIIKNMIRAKMIRENMILRIKRRRMMIIR